MATTRFVPDGFELPEGAMDVDRLCAQGIPIEMLGFPMSCDVDLAAGIHFQSTSENLERMGFPIVSGPQLLFVRSMAERAAFHRALQGQDRYRYLPLSPNPNKFLDTPNARRIRSELVVQALVDANIDFANLFCFGMKSSVALNS